MLVGRMRNTLRYHPYFSDTATRSLSCIDAEYSKVKTSPNATTFLSKDKLLGDLGNPRHPCCLITASGSPINFEGKINPEGTDAGYDNMNAYPAAMFGSEMLWCVRGCSGTGCARDAPTRALLHMVEQAEYSCLESDYLFSLQYGPLHVACASKRNAMLT